MKFTTLRSWLGGQVRSRNLRRNRLSCERLEDRVQPSGSSGHEVAIAAAAHYWANDQQIDLDVRAHELVVGLTPGTGSIEPLLAANGPLSGMTVTQWITSDLAILDEIAPAVGDPVAELNGRLAAVSGAAGVTFAAPLYQNPTTGGWLIATNELIVALKPGFIASAVLADSRFTNWEPLSGTPDQFIVRAAAGYGPAVFDLNAQLQQDTRFAWVAPNFYQDFRPFFTPNDSLYSTQWHLNNTAQNAGATADADVDAPEAWDVTQGNQNVIVAVVDTGMEFTHPDLAPNIAINAGEIPASVLALLTDVDADGIIRFLDLNVPVNIGAGKAVDLNGNGRIDPADILSSAAGGWSNGADNDGNGYIDDLCGWDFTTNGTTGDNNPIADGSGSTDAHSTSVAGVTVGVGNNNTGTTGIAFKSRILASRIFGITGASTTDANIASAVYYAAGRTRSGTGTFRAGDITNNSWGGGSFSTAIRDAFLWASTSGRGGLGAPSFIAAGNSGASSVSFPGTLASSNPGVICVGASTDRDLRASYSQYGPELDFMAPSNGGVVGIVTTDRTGANGYSSADYTTGGQFGGTSSATPLAAGIGALIMSVNLNLTATQIRGLMRNTTDYIGPASPTYDSTTGWNGEFGYGRVNANTAVRGIGVTEIQVLDGRTNVPDNSGSVNLGSMYVGNTVTRVIRVRNQGTLPLTLGTPILTGPFELAAGFGSTTFTVGQTTTFSVRFVPTATGAAAGTVSFTTNDADEGTFNFALTGTGLAPSLGGQAFEDWTGNAARDAIDPAISGRTVYIDLNGNSAFDATLATTPYASGNVNVAIPDNNSTGITNNQTVSGSTGVVTKVTVTVNITHTYTGDLAIDLIGPTGTVVSLSNMRGTGANFTNTVFSDTAGTPISSGAAPYTGTYRPEELLSAFNGVTGNGTWGLRVRDLASVDTGTLVNWTLTLTTGEQNQATTAAGQFGFGGLGAGTYSVRTVTPAGWASTAPASGVYTITLPAGGSVTGLDFGSVRQNAVYGQVINDLDGDGVRDAGEPGMVNFRTYDDRDGNGALNGAEANVLSTTNGNYVLTGLAAGATTIRIVPQIGYRNTLAASGIPLTLVANGTTFNRDFGAIADNTPPTADVIDVTPDPRYTSVNSMTITFSEAVTGFDLADLTLTRNGGGNLLTGSQTLTTSDSITWTLGNLGGLTAAAGNYSLTLAAAGVTDLALNPVAANASDSWQVVPLPSITIGDATVTEGDSGTVSASFAVALSAPAVETVTVSFSTADGTALLADGDYLTNSGTLTFLVGESSQSVIVTVNGDPLNEADETFFVNLTSPTNGTLGDAQGLATILNDDPVPTLSIDSVTQFEGDSGTTAFTFTVTLSAASGQTVTVDYFSEDITATMADGDYSSATGTLIFTPGTTTRTITVLANGDSRNETDETFDIALSNAINANILIDIGTGTITNDDPIPTLSINSVTHNEGNAGTTAYTFTVALSAASGRTVTVDFATADGTATVSGGDYSALSGTLTFAPDTTTQTFTVLVPGDTRNELDETFGVSLSAASNATITVGTGTGTITNDDPVPSFSIDSVTRNEGNTGTTSYTFTVTLSAASGRTTTVNYATANGSATVADGDYAATSGTLTYAPGATTHTFTVLVNGDAKNEINETFGVSLSGATNSTIAVGSGTGTITNDDPVPTLSVNSLTQPEGNSGTTAFTFTVSLSAVSGQTVTVNYATSDGNALIADGDYQAASGTLSFTPGVTTRTFTVLATGDAKNEINESFGVSIGGATNSTIAVGSGTGTLTNDDPLPTLSINSSTQLEGNAGTATFTFTATLSAVSGQTVTVNYATADGTALIADGDYQAASGSLTFAPGVTTRTFLVLANGDARNEINESFGVSLSSASNATIAVALGTGTITNDDPVPTLSINSLTQLEGDTGTTAFAFTVTLSAISGQTVTVNYATANGTATVADGDYSAASGTLAFPPGITTQTITVLANGDLRNEIDEIFGVSLSGASNATIAVGSGTGTLTNDDPVPTLSIDSVVVNEGDSGTTALTFTVTLSAVSGQTVTFNFATADGGALVADGDYQAANGTLTFAPGVTTRTITIDANGDDAYEADDDFAVILDSPTNATIAVGTGTATLTNDDAVPTVELSLSGSPFAETGGMATATLSLSKRSYLPVSVTFAFSGTASVSDYSVSATSLTVPAGSFSGSITLAGLNDIIDENDETVRVTIDTIADGTVGTVGSVTAMLADDDLPTASDDRYNLFEDVPFTSSVRLLGNDTAAPGSTVEIVGLDPTGIAFSLQPNGQFTYSSLPDFFGTVLFQYRVRNLAGEVSAPATVRLDIAGVNDAPLFVVGANQIDPRRAGPQEVASWASSIRTGPANEGGQQLAFLVTTDRPDLFLVQPAIIAATGILTYTPSSAFGTATVAVRLKDTGGTNDNGSDTSTPQTFTITIHKYQDDDMPTNQYESNILAAGSGDAGAAVAFRGDGTIAYSAKPFAGAGSRTATADVTGDGVPDLIVATGPGVRSRVVVLDGVTHSEVRMLLPFEDSFTGGLFVAAADLDGDGLSEIAVSPDVGGGGRVTVFSGKTSQPFADFFGIDDAKFRGGARVAFGDVNGDGRPDMVVAAGFGGGPRIAIFDGASMSNSLTRIVGDFFGFPGKDAKTLLNGTYVAAGDVDGDGFADLVLGGGPGGAPRVFALSGKKIAAGDVAGAQAAPIANFFVANDSTNVGGVRVAVKDLDGDDRADVAVGSGDGLASRVRLYFGAAFTAGSGEPSEFRDLDPFNQVLTSGVFVG